METLIIETQEQAEALVVNNLLKFEGHLIFKCRINAGWSIKAGGYIKAGADWGIYCGISLRISNKSQATITAKSEPANILLGLFVK